MPKAFGFAHGDANTPPLASTADAAAMMRNVFIMWLANIPGR
jgi:hypothetical protein